MRKQIRLIGLACILLSINFACGDNGEKQARIKLTDAEFALNSGDYNRAKQEIDSIRILYPKAFEARKEGIRLMQRVDLAEQERTLAYLDNLLSSFQILADGMKDNFTFEKNEEYQEVGNYFYPTQVVEKNINRSFLRAQVDERGKMTLTSIYCGQRSIHHKSIKVVAPDATFAETPLSSDTYESVDLGMKIEKADYSLGNDGGVIPFITLNSEQPLKVQFLGERAYTSQMRPDDRTAIAELYKLSQVLSSIEQAKKDKEEANRKITFVKRKMQEE